MCSKDSKGGGRWFGDDEVKVRAERARAIGLFRYQLIREAADPAHSTKERGKMVRELASREHTDPFGRRVRVSRPDHRPLDQGLAGRRVRRAGAQRRASARRAPRRRCWSWRWRCAGRTRSAPPRRSAGSCGPSWAGRPTNAPCNATSTGSGSPAARLTGSAPVFGRFEAEHRNDLWTGDALHGIRIQLRKTYLFAFLDDHSRLLPGYRWGHAEDTVRLAAALRPALASRGVPEAIYVDNGSPFVDAVAAAGMRETCCAPGPFDAKPARRTGQNRAAFSGPCAISSWSRSPASPTWSAATMSPTSTS